MKNKKIETIKCPKCNSKNIKISDLDFAFRKGEGESAKKWDGTTKTKYFCWDCGCKWETWQDFIKRKEQNFLEDLKNKKPVSIKDIGRQGKAFFIREDWKFFKQYNLDEKVFVIEKLRKYKTEGKKNQKKSWEKGKIEYRIGYYIVGKIGKTEGSWRWGQFCPFVPEENMEELLFELKRIKNNPRRATFAKRKGSFGKD